MIKKHKKFSAPHFINSSFTFSQRAEFEGVQDEQIDGPELMGQQHLVEPPGLERQLSNSSDSSHMEVCQSRGCTGYHRS
jgi:hypothetical protein